MGISLKLLEDQIVAWALTQPVIRAAIIGGSTARQVNPADEWADLDFELYMTDFGEFASSAEWLKQFGIIWTVLQLQENGNPVILALYEGGQKVDFHFFPVDELQRLNTTQVLPDACQRGYRVVVDKDQLASKLPLPRYEAPVYEKPSEEAFEFQVHAFWYGVVYAAKLIRRRNLWVVKAADWRIKQNLLKILEWHAQATHPYKMDTWHDGHFISQWVDEQTRAAFQDLFGLYEPRSSWLALFASIGLFHDLAIETARSLGYKYPLDLDRKVIEFVRSLSEADDLVTAEQG